jgi:hypothetical protein
MIEFDAVVANPPFEDFNNRKKTPHKLWIDFTHEEYRLLKPNGTLAQISPSSFLSPSSKILPYFLNNDTEMLSLDTEKYFDVGSTFADYIIRKNKTNTRTTIIEKNGSLSTILLDSSIFYLPNDFCGISLSIHKKVMFGGSNKLKVDHDYVTCHNIVLKNNNSTLSTEQTSTHVHPIFHTNAQVWYSSVKQSFASDKKVMWTRSGYTKPFYDDGIYGVTDMGYYVTVPTKQTGEYLAHNLNSKLFKYIFETAKWSGFGNEKVFGALPVLPNRQMTDDDLYAHFSLTPDEIHYVENYQTIKKNNKATAKTLVTNINRTQSRVRQTAEVFTCDELSDRLISKMDSVYFTDSTQKILEPSAGNGQLVLAILRRMKQCGRTDWKHILEHQLYICEYMQDNVDEMMSRISDFVGFDITTTKHNIVWSDFLKFIKKVTFQNNWTDSRYHSTQTERLVEPI